MGVTHSLVESTLTRSRDPTRAAWVVRLGRLQFEDFTFLDPPVIREALSRAAFQTDLGPAISNEPRVLFHLLEACPDLEPQLVELYENATVASVSAIRAAKERLVREFAFELLQAKAPMLYECLPWQEWDFSVVRQRFRLWRTRLLLAGESSSVTVCRCRGSAGVHVIEPRRAMAEYTRRKAAAEKVKPVTVIETGIDRIPLGAAAVDLAIVGWPVWPARPDSLAEVLRVSKNGLVVLLRPGADPIPDDWLRSHGFLPGQVKLVGTGEIRRCFWKLAGTGSATTSTLDWRDGGSIFGRVDETP